jgi:MFS family permease
MSAGDSRRWWVLATMTGSLSMIMIDQTVVGVALPTMRVDLALSSTGVQWVVNAYLLVFAVLVALGGRAGDLRGPARMFKLGVSVRARLGGLRAGSDRRLDDCGAWAAGGGRRDHGSRDGRDRDALVRAR